MRRLTLASLALALGLQVATSQSIRLQLDGMPHGIVSMDGSSNGNWLAIASWLENADDGYLKLWNLTDDKTYTSPFYFPSYQPDFDVTCVRFVPNYEVFATIGQLSPLRVFEYRTGSPTDTGWWQIAQFGVQGRTMAVAPNFDAVAIADSLGEIRVLRGIFSQFLTRDQGFRPQLAFAPDGSLLATAGARVGGGSVRLWNTSTYSMLIDLPTPFECTSVAFSPNGAYLAVGGVGGELRVYRLMDYAYLDVQAHAGRLAALQFTPDSSRVVSGGQDGFVRVWDVSNLAQQVERATGYGVLSLFVSPDGQFLHTGGVDGQVDRWQLATLQHERELTRPWQVHGFRTGSREVWVSDGAQTRVYDAQGQLVQQIPLRGIFSPDKQWAITQDGVVRVSDGQIVLSGVSQGVFSPDSRYALVQEAGGVAMYRTDTWSRLWQAQRSADFLRVRFSRNSARFVEGNAVYDAPTGVRLGIYSADLLTLSDDGARVALVREQDERVQVEMLRLADNALLWQATYDAPLSGEVHDAVFAGDGRYLLVWAGEYIVCFDAATGQLLSETGAPQPRGRLRLLLTPDSYRLLIAHDYERNAFLITPVARLSSERWFFPAPLGYTIDYAELSSDGAALLVQTSDSSVFVVSAGLTTGDVNGDNCVDDADLLETLFSFGHGNARADLNGDSIVDDADLLLVLFNFGNGC